MKHLLYREAISHSFRFAWKQKGLWIFGLFATFLGQMGLMPLLSSVGLIDSGYGGTQTVSYLGMFFGSLTFANFSTLSSTVITGTVWLVIMLLVVALAIFSFAIISQGAIIHSASKSFKLLKTLPSPNKAWHMGAKHFWRLFGLQAVKKAILLLCGAAVYFTTALAVGSTDTMWAAMSSVSFVLACILGFVISFLLTYASCFVMVEESSLGDAIEQAWQMFKAHWLVSIEVGFVVLLCNILLGFFAMFAFLVFFTPALILFVISLILGTEFIAMFAAMVTLTLFIVFILWIGSVFTVFSTSMWTYVFVKMHTHGLHSHLLHWNRGDE